MRIRDRGTFLTIKTEGSLLPPDLLQNILDRGSDLEGLTPEDFHLAKGEKVNEAINRSWTRILGAWQGFSAALENLDPGNPGTALTRDRWLQIIFQELGFGRLPASKAIEIEGKTYPISHQWQHTPIHLIGARLNLDKRTPGVAGAARVSPHSLVQELLSRSENHLWGIVSNGYTLRILKDNISLTRQAYLEFDLRMMMEGEVYSDFVLFWILCHQSRFEGERPESCWLEKWSNLAQEQGTRALDQLRDGVKQAITLLGAGFISFPKNTELKERLRKGNLNTQDYYRQLLRLVYRFLFLFVAEDRGMLFDPLASPAARKIYEENYSISRLRRLALRRCGSRHCDMYRSLLVVLEKLDTGEPKLGLPALGSFLWSSAATADLAAADIANFHLLKALRALTVITEGNTKRVVDYKHLGSEELGSVYESLLEMHPELNIDAGSFTLSTGGGNERKVTGSYYTPASLIKVLLDSALDPILNEAVKKPDPRKALLGLKVCDPACGSGHFLIAAAHRIAKHLAAVETGDDEPAPEALRTALRKVIGTCLYAVDVNEMAVELCKVSLWMEGMEPGKPLSFLEHRIQVGNSLLGATPKLMKDGIPDAAFSPIEGDDRKICSEAKKRNQQQEDIGQLEWFEQVLEKGLEYTLLSHQNIDRIGDETIANVRMKQEKYELMLESKEYQHNKLAADAWCAAFVWKKTRELPYPITREIFRTLESSHANVPGWMITEIRHLAKEYHFLHWHLAFPDVFIAQKGNSTNGLTGWSGGFDAVLGNPPWERIKIQEKEWFAQKDINIATAPNAAARRRLIQLLKKDNPKLYGDFLNDKRIAEGESHFLRNSGRYPLCGRGDINTYAVFAEHKRHIISPTGRVGCIVPSGIATDDTTKFFFQDITDTRALFSLYDFENRKAIFPGVHRSFKFCLLTLLGKDRPAKEGAQFVFFAHATEDLKDDKRRFTLSMEDIYLLNPNTKTCPIFRTKRDAEITKKVYQRVPVLIKEGPPEENPWGISFKTMFHMANDSHLFKTRKELTAESYVLEGNIFRKGESTYLPLYEGKMIHHYDFRWSSAGGESNRAEVNERVKNAKESVQPRYWVNKAEVKRSLPEGHVREWLLGWRNITNVTNERTTIALVLPLYAVGNSMPLIISTVSPKMLSCLQANLSAFVLDYIARMKVGGTNLTFNYIRQFPVLPPNTYKQRCPWQPNLALEDWISQRVLELNYTSFELAPYAKDMGYGGDPFPWSPERRFQLRCELDACFFYLYGVDPRDVDYILDTFPIVKRKELERYQTYRIKEIVLSLMGK